MYRYFPTNQKTYIFNSAHVYSPLDLDEPIITPVAAPRVLHQPVVDAIFSTIADNKDSVVLVGLEKKLEGSTTLGLLTTTRCLALTDVQAS